MSKRWLWERVVKKTIRPYQCGDKVKIFSHTQDSRFSVSLNSVPLHLYVIIEFLSISFMVFKLF